MKDPLFVEFSIMRLNEQITADKETISGGQLTLDEVIATAQGIKAKEAQIARLQNPRTRKPKVVETPIGENPVGEAG